MTRNIKYHSIALVSSLTNNAGRILLALALATLVPAALYAALTLGQSVELEITRRTIVAAMM